MEPSTLCLNPQFPFSRRAYLTCPLPSLLRCQPRWYLKGSSYQRNPQGEHPEDREQTEPALHRTLRSTGNLQGVYVLWVCPVLALKTAKVLLFKVCLHWEKHLESAASCLLVRYWDTSAVREKIITLGGWFCALDFYCPSKRNIFPGKWKYPLYPLLITYIPQTYHNQNFVLKTYYSHFCEEDDPLVAF